MPRPQHSSGPLEQVGFTLRPDDKQRLTDRAHAQRRGISDLVRDAVQRFLSTYDDGLIPPVSGRTEHVGAALPVIDRVKLSEIGWRRRQSLSLVAAHAVSTYLDDTESDNVL